MLSACLLRDSSGYNAFIKSRVIPYVSTGASALFNGSSQYLTVNASSDFSVGTGDFTIEWFQYALTPQNSHPRIFAIGNYPSTTIGVSIEGGLFYLWLNGGANFGYSLSNYLNQWVHFAIVRNGSTVNVYQNGTSLSSITYSSSISNSSTNLAIGQETSPSSGSYVSGNITNFRWTNSAIYTSNFVKPTSPLSALPQTKLLLLFSSSGNLLTDSSGTGKTVTNNGGVSWNVSTPF